MKAYIAKRLLQSVLVLLGVSVFSFAFIFLTGDPVAPLVGPDWTQEAVEELRRELGFDRPIPVQYLDFLTNAIRGDFGNSLRHHRPVFQLLVERLPATIELAGIALVLSIIIGIPLGILSAVRRGSGIDQASMSFALLAQAMPTFWLGIMLILLVGVDLRWLPPSGRGTIAHLILPAITLATYGIARNARLVRSSMLDVLQQDYIRTARSKGLGPNVVIYKHALRNALIPVITIIGLDFGSLLAGAVITETVFAWPGVGRLIVSAVAGRDLPLVQAALLSIGALFTLMNIVVDLAYAVVDPRIRYG